MKRSQARERRARASAAASFLIAFSASASAQVVTVTTAEDVIDVNPQTATLADLPGPDGRVSFSEAMIATNNTPGHQTVGFAIPPDEWIFQFLFPGRAVITSTVGFYFRAFDEVTIDGTTQTAVTGDTNPDGWEVVIYGVELYLNADDCTLIGFDSTSVSFTESSGRVEGNTGSMNITLFGGSGTLVKDNTGGTIKIDRSNDNEVVGNTVSRVRVLGFGSGQPAANNRIGGPNLADRNFITGYGTWNSDGYPSGTTVQLFDTVGTVIENNWIGTTPDGLAQGSLASIIGIGLESQNSDTTIRGNRIAGILGHGQPPHAAGQLFGWAVLVSGSGSGLTLVGNTVGLDANEEPTLGSVWGIDVGNPVTHPSTITDIRIGGALPGEGNVIAGHILNGITVGRGVGQVRLQGNSFHENGWLGIDLIPTGYGYGVTPNDPLDLDTGGSGLQNFPELLFATPQGDGTRALGTLHSSPDDAFRLEFFASSECDDSGHGEGRRFLGATDVTTDGGGDGSFDVLLPALTTAGELLTATATLEPLGATSEFSACLAIGGDDAGALFCDGGPGACPCGNPNDAGGVAGCANSSGAGATLRAVGSTSVATDELVLLGAQVPANQNGLLFMGSGVVPPVPFGDGLRCVAGPFFRYPIASSGAAGTFTYGPGLVEFTQTHFAPPGRIQPGSTWRFQTWFRDPGGPCGLGFNLSNGLELLFTP